MLRQSHTPKDRIRKTSEFQEVYKEGKRFVTRHFVFFFKGLGGQSTRLGLTVTKDVGCAPERNRIKRQVREAFRLGKDGLPAGMLIVKAKRSAANFANNELREDVDGGLLKLRKRGG